MSGCTSTWPGDLSPLARRPEDPFQHPFCICLSPTAISTDTDVYTRLHQPRGIELVAVYIGTLYPLSKRRLCRGVLRSASRQRRTDCAVRQQGCHAVGGFWSILRYAITYSPGIPSSILISISLSIRGGRNPPCTQRQCFKIKPSSAHKKGRTFGAGNPAAPVEVVRTSEGILFSILRRACDRRCIKLRIHPNITTSLSHVCRSPPASLHSPGPQALIAKQQARPVHGPIQRYEGDYRIRGTLAERRQVSIYRIRPVISTSLSLSTIGWESVE